MRSFFFSQDIDRPKDLRLESMDLRVGPAVTQVDPVCDSIPVSDSNPRLNPTCTLCNERV